MSCHFAEYFGKVVSQGSEMDWRRALLMRRAGWREIGERDSLQVFFSFANVGLLDFFRKGPGRQVMSFAPGELPVRFSGRTDTIIQCYNSNRVFPFI